MTDHDVEVRRRGAGRRGPPAPRVTLLLVAVAALAACTAGDGGPPGPVAGTPAAAGTPAPPVAASPAPPSTVTSPAAPTSAAVPASPAAPTSAAAPASPAAPAGPDAVAVRFRLEVRPADLTGAAAAIRSVLADARGWSRAGFRFVEAADAPYRIVVAEGAEVDRLCAPYDTDGRWSCQNGPVVALNADRWRTATATWSADLDAYRTMLVNHEVGHLLHLHHPLWQCPGPGVPAPVMAQQSTELDGCRPNPWPLDWEVDLAARRLEPLAPPADHDPSGHRPRPPPAG